MKVRPLQPADLEKWSRMRTALWPHCTIEVNRLEINLMLSKPDRCVIFVSERDNGELNGFIEVGLRDVAQDCYTSPVGYIEGWYVDPDVRRTSIGRALVEAGENWARSKGCTEMASDAHVTNEISHEAHQHLGYERGEAIVTFHKKLALPA